MRSNPLLSLAFYLPQFHTIPENDAWWGKGFTEWTHLQRARTYYRGQQIRRPVAPLGEYSLLDLSVFEQQMHIARSHAIDGFLVWDYWFGRGKRLLEQPLELVLRERLDFRYALAWANHSWLDRSNGRLLCQQHYLGAEDYTRYFEHSARHFERDTYVKIDNRPVFYILAPKAVPDLPLFMETWHRLAEQRGFAGMYFVGDYLQHDSPLAAHFDAYCDGFGFWTTRKKLVVNYLKEKLRTKLGLVVGRPQRFDYYTMVRDAIPSVRDARFAPTVITGWDTTPRHARRGVVFDGLDSRSFARHLGDISRALDAAPSERTPLVLIKSWNEWAEGNLLEPDSVHGYSLLEEYRKFASAVGVPAPSLATSASFAIA